MNNLADRPRIYIPHEPCRWDAAVQSCVPIYDLGPATKHGTLTPLLPRGPLTLSSREVVAKLREQLQDFTDDDFILCIGDPVIVASACMVAAQINGDYAKVLRYDRHNKEYRPVEINLGE